MRFRFPAGKQIPKMDFQGAASPSRQNGTEREGIKSSEKTGRKLAPEE